MYEAGRRLVAEHKLGPADILWDADEVLWDWAMPFGRMLSVAPKVLFRQYGHREWIALRPGIIGLLAGLHDGAVEAGLDPWMRLWTAGYPWRLWKIFEAIPAFHALLGPSGAKETGSPEALAAHPRLMARGDLIRVILDLLDPDRGEAILTTLPEPIRPMVVQQLDDNPGHGGFKIPEIAVAAGKPEVSTTSILVDDTRANVEYFTTSGRRAVWVQSPTPRVLFGRVPNSLWFRPARWLAALDHALVPAIAAALERASTESGLTVASPADLALRERLAFPSETKVEHLFALDIPNAIFWRDWFGPMKAVKRAAKRRHRLS